MVDAEYLRRHYGTLDDDELERLARSGLVPEARAILEAELQARGLPVPAPPPDEDEKEAVPAWTDDELRRSPYSPPRASLGDQDARATLSVGGLIRWFQLMVVASTLIGMFLFGWHWLPLPIDEGALDFRYQSGAGALAYNLGRLISLVLQPLWILSAIGLCFFQWWARPMFVATYALGAISTLVGGFVIWFPWEAVLVTAVTLLDGAVIALAFLPPLAGYFARERA